MDRYVTNWSSGYLCYGNVVISIMIFSLDIPVELPRTVIPNYPHEIQKGFLLTTIPTLPKQFEVTFNYQATKYYGSWSSILHMRSTVNGQMGQRVPGFFPLNNKILVAFAVDGNWNWNFWTPVFPLHKWISFQVTQTMEAKTYVYRVYMDGKLLKEHINKKPRLFDDVGVWVGNKEYHAQNGFVKNLVIKSKSHSCSVYLTIMLP